MFNVPTESRYVVIQESDPKITCILMIKLAHLFASIRLYLHPACGGRKYHTVTQNHLVTLIKLAMSKEVTLGTQHATHNNATLQERA